MSSATLSELLDALDGGAVLLLPNARAAQSLRARFNDRQRGRGLAAWEPAQVLSWPQWASAQWSDLVVAGAESRLLLNRAQEHSLWRELIAADEEMELIGSADALAELAQSAWELAAAYNATQRLREFAATHDSRAFAGWAETFSRRCAARGYLSQAQMDAALLQHVEAGTLRAPASLRLVGFAELQPSQQALLAAMRAAGTDVSEQPLEYAGSGERRRLVLVAEKEPEELRLAARWIRETLEGAVAEGRDARVAMLVPDLSETRAEIDDVLRETLAPELQSIEADLSSTPWEISGGVPLASVSLVADALALARWAEGALPLARVSGLLLSPYVGANGENSAALAASARFDAGKLRRALVLRPEMDLSSVLELAEEWARGQAPGGEAVVAWLRSVQAFLRKAGERSKPRGFGAWMEFVRGLVKAANWPGDRALTAQEFAATTAWESVLDLVATLDFSGRTVSLGGALDELERQAEVSLFSAPSTDASVQVMRVAEAEGSIFDAVVLVRATDANWPAVERVHPLLPWALQRSLGMPGSDSSRAAMRGRAFAEDLMRRSGSVLFTYAKEDESGALRASPLLAELQVEEVASVVARREYREGIAFESVADAEPLPPLPSNEIAGGAAVLKQQAACGFLAFAQFRLRAAEPKSGDMGLDAGESGNLVHRALQHFWREVETQEALRLLSAAERDGILAASIDAALPKRLHARDEWDLAYVALQKDRLRSVLRRWLDVELQRGPFTVLDVERKAIVPVGPLSLEVRLDRIDRVGEDGFFFVDYKTGYAADPKQWSGERPDEPQLPLYTMLPEAGELKGVAFAKVRAGREMKWAGYQAEEGILPTSRTNVRDMTSLVEEWHGTLTMLAQDFAAGKAGVRPKSFEVNCTRCGQRLLCRVDPTSLDAERVEEEQVEAEEGWGADG